MRGSGLASIYDWNFTSIPQENLVGSVALTSTEDMSWAAPRH